MTTVLPKSFIQRALQTAKEGIEGTTWKHIAENEIPVGTIELPSSSVFGRSGMSPDTLQITTNGRAAGGSQRRTSYLLRLHPLRSDEAIIVAKTPMDKFGILNKEDAKPVLGRDREAVTKQFMREMNLEG